MATATYTPKDSDIERDETYSLIASDKVEGTKVYNAAGESIGRIHNFMVDKISGRVVYVVVSFGGFLGVGEDYFPLPWETLAYDTTLGGYITNVDHARLSDAPRYAADDDRFWSDPTYPGGIDRHWTMPVM